RFENSFQSRDALRGPVRCSVVGKAWPSILIVSILASAGTATPPHGAPRGDVRCRRRCRLPPATESSSTLSSGPGASSRGAGAVKLLTQGNQGNAGTGF